MIEISGEIVAGRLQRRILRPPGVNPHVLVLGDSGSGKDYLTRHLLLGLAAPLARAVVLDVTRYGAAPGMLGDPTWAGWGTDAGEGAELAALPERLEQPRYRVLVPPGDAGRAVVAAALEVIDAAGETVLVVSDAGRITEPARRGGLDLGGPLARLMGEGRKRSITVIACSTSTKWAEGAVKDQARTKFLGITSTADERKQFAELAGLERRKDARDALEQLAPRQFLYVDYADGRPALAVTSAPAQAA